MNAEFPMTEHVVPGWAGRSRRKPRQDWSPFDRQKLERMWLKGAPAEQIADELGREVPSIYAKVYQMGLPRRRAAAEARRKRGHVRKGDTSGQRRFNGVQSDREGARIVLQPYDPRLRAGTTIFPTTVQPASKLARLLKSGHNSRKIGKTVAKGRLRGAPIFTLTLEERATCPSTCPVWAVCYGNNMPFAQRIWDDGTLTRRLWGELAALQAEHPSGFLVRLHVLGDFYSPEYVAFWRSALEDFSALNIFGFTARQPTDPIGWAVVELVRDHYQRCRIRFSGLAMEEDGAVVVDTKEAAVGVVCPRPSWIRTGAAPRARCAGIPTKPSAS